MALEIIFIAIGILQFHFHYDNGNETGEGKGSGKRRRVMEKDDEGLGAREPSTGRCNENFGRRQGIRDLGGTMEQEKSIQLKIRGYDERNVTCVIS